MPARPKSPNEASGGCGARNEKAYTRYWKGRRDSQDRVDLGTGGSAYTPAVLREDGSPFVLDFTSNDFDVSFIFTSSLVLLKAVSSFVSTSHGPPLLLGLLMKRSSDEADLGTFAVIPYHQNASRRAFGRRDLPPARLLALRLRTRLSALF